MPPGKDPNPRKVVWKPKLDGEGNNACYKARLVARGCVQKDGAYYYETLAPVIPFYVFLFFDGNLTAVGWHVHHADIFTVFLNVEDDGALYVQSGNKCYELQKILYCLKKSPYH